MLHNTKLIGLKNVCHTQGVGGRDGSRGGIMKERGDGKERGRERDRRDVDVEEGGKARGRDKWEGGMRKGGGLR